jgi:hypothetical protein
LLNYFTELRINGERADRINGGPDNDQIYPNAYTIRDFLTDSADCGSGIDTIYRFYSGDIETVTYCENIRNNDG